MIAAIFFSAIVLFAGSTVTQTLDANARVPDRELTASLSRDPSLSGAAQYAHMSTSAFVRKHFAVTNVRLDSGTRLAIVRVVIAGMDAMWCGMNNCPFSVWTLRSGAYDRVLSESGQDLEIFADGSAEVAGHASAMTEDYVTFGWTGRAFTKNGYFDTQGHHANLPASQSIAFDPGDSWMTISGDTRGAQPGEPYAFTARAGQLVTLKFKDGAARCRFAIDRGTTSYVIASGASLSYRLPEDGRYTLAVLRDGLELSHFRFDITIH